MQRIVIGLEQLDIIRRNLIDANFFRFLTGTGALPDAGN